MPKKSQSWAVGSLWRPDDTDKPYVLSGTIKINGEDVRIAVFKNDKKESKRHPDFRISAYEDAGATKDRGIVVGGGGGDEDDSDVPF
jgi:uncharacterized protein (DUF736 family)